MPVFLPDEQVGCLFEALGTVTVQGPFPAPNRGGAESDDMMNEVRSKLGVEAARAGADGALVRRFIYDRDRPLPRGEPPTLLAVEGVLLDFVDPTCRPDPALGVEVGAADGIGDSPRAPEGLP